MSALLGISFFAYALINCIRGDILYALIGFLIAAIYHLVWVFENHYSKIDGLSNATEVYNNIVAKNEGDRYENK